MYGLYGITFYIVTLVVTLHIIYFPTAIMHYTYAALVTITDLFAVKT